MKRFFIIIILSSLVGACASTGDFDRPKESKMRTVLSGQLSRIGLAGKKSSPLPLTSIEHDLRNLARHFDKPATIPFLAVRTEYEPASLRVRRRGHELANAVTSTGYVSAQSRVVLFNKYIRRDVEVLMRLVRSVDRVVAQDLRRYETLVGGIEYSEQDHANARMRIKENRAIIAGLNSSIGYRIQNYDNAISRARLEVPSDQLEQSEIALGLLRERFGLMQSMYENYTVRTSGK